MTDTLYLDWVRALGLVRPTVGVQEIKKILCQTSLRWGSRTEVGVEIASITNRPAIGLTGAPRSTVVLVNPRLGPLYDIERIECLQRIALRVWQYYTERTDLTIKGFYDALGVLQSPLLDPQVRWHHLGMKYHLGEVSASEYENRPRCPVCKIHVATGHTNPKIHNGCQEYVRNVYAPALRAQQQKVIA